MVVPIIVIAPTRVAVPQVGKRKEFSDLVANQFALAIVYVIA